MATLNKVMLMGRVTDTPEPPRTLPNSGTRVIKFRFAVGRGRKNEQGGWDQDPNQLFIDCEAYSKQDAKRDLVHTIQEYVKKGDSIYVEGRLQLDQWTDKTTNLPRSKHKVVVDGIEFLGGNRNEGGEGGGNFNRGEAGGGGSFNRGGSGGPGRPAPTGGGKPAGFSPPPRDDDGGGDYNGGSGGGDNHGEPIPF